MTVSDGFGGGSPPPGVSARRVGGGRFEAEGPMFTRVRASFDVRSDGRGGSIVTERFHAANPIPVFGAVLSAGADLVHSVATNPATAYELARRRG